MSDKATFDSDRRFHHRKDVVNGVSLHSVTAGSGPAVLFVHGWPQTWWEWRRILPALAHDYSVIAVDLRGFGEQRQAAARRRL